MKYRPDIDGLRSVAVLSVLLFHAGFKHFSGGFVGVDVFFVISGYLITRIIHDEVLETKTFNFSNFYVRRARRLFPALFFTLALSGIFACLLLSPDYLKRFAGSLIWAIASVSNIFFWRESGYFDADSGFKPLLHTWSLGVEEQFYLVWPVLFVFLLLKAPKFTALITVFIAGVVSFYLNHVFLGGELSVLSKLSPGVAAWFADGASAIFYLMPFRVFEFAVGASLVWLIKYQPKNKMLLEPLVAIGLAMIAYAVFTYTEDTVFPSYNALMPCIGAALVIYSGTARHVGRLLNNPAAVGVGLISYSLYLVHWPIIVLYRYYKLDRLTFREQWIIMAVCIIAAVLMYRFVERPFRRRTNTSLSPRRFGTVCVMSALVIILPASVLRANNGWESRFNNKSAFISIDEITTAGEKRFQYYLESGRGCNITDLAHCNKNADMQILTFGNSHELDAYNALTSQYGQRNNINIISFGSSYGCGFKLEKGRVINTINNSQLHCSYRADMLNNEKFISSLDIIAFRAYKPLSWGEGLMEILEHITKTHKHINTIFFSGYFGVRPYRCSDIINRFGNSSYCKEPRFVEYFAGNDKDKILNMPMARTNFLYVDEVGLFCDGSLLKNCLTEISGVPAFYDGDHFSVEFSKLLGEKMRVLYSDELSMMGL
ncbi:MAG: acyltransferase [Nitrospirae bacterium]|nr:acyltransferase [Nitrospirota bacterium]